MRIKNNYTVVFLLFLLPLGLSSKGEFDVPVTKNITIDSIWKKAVILNHKVDTIDDKNKKARQLLVQNSKDLRSIKTYAVKTEKKVIVLRNENTELKKEVINLMQENEQLRADSGKKEEQTEADKKRKSWIKRVLNIK